MNILLCFQQFFSWVIWGNEPPKYLSCLTLCNLPVGAYLWTSVLCQSLTQCAFRIRGLIMKQKDTLPKSWGASSQRNTANILSPLCTCCVYMFQSAATALTVSWPFVCVLQRPSRGPTTPTTPHCACPSTLCAPATTWTSSSPSLYASTSSPWASSTTISHR